MSFLAKQFRIARPTQQLEKVIEFYSKGLGLEIIGEFYNHAGYDGVMIGDKHYPYWLNNSVTFEDPDGWRVVLYCGLYAIK
ncbi:MAG: hypothetical protein IPO24_16260 [Bacteroidetes bacterium]|nr:hypothetical protein [Bacteroidota bacterium]